MHFFLLLRRCAVSRLFRFPSPPIAIKFAASDRHLLAEVAHEQNRAREQTRGAEQVLVARKQGGGSGRRDAEGRASRKIATTEGVFATRMLAIQYGCGAVTAPTMVPSRFWGENSFSITSLMPMVVVCASRNGNDEALRDTLCRD